MKGSGRVCRELQIGPKQARFAVRKWLFPAPFAFVMDRGPLDL